MSWLLMQMPAPLISPEHRLRSPDPIVVTLPVEPEPSANNVVTRQDSTALTEPVQIARTDAQPRATGSTGTKAAAQTEIARHEHRLDLNRATQAELELLPGIGPGLAKRILDYKQSHGQYKTVEELREVKGIGEKRWRRLEPLLMVVTTAPPAPSGAHKRANPKNG